MTALSALKDNSDSTVKNGSQSGSSSNAQQPATAASATESLANEQTFLKLFIAQLQNQDPEQPQNGLDFVTQLAQFSSLEQTIQMRQDLDSINKYMGTAPAAGSDGTNGSGDTSGSGASGTGNN